MGPFGDITDMTQVINKVFEFIREVTQASTGVSQLITALTAFVATITGRIVSGRPIIVLPVQPGQPRPRIFSPKAILKGWIVTTLAWVILVVVLVAYVRSLETELLLPQLFQQRWMEFLISERGTAALCAVTGLACALGAHSAAKQAKCFRLTYAFLSVGSLYLACGFIIARYFPVTYAESVALSPPSWRTLEPLSALIGSLIGGIMGAED